MRYRSWALTRHRGVDDCTDFLRRFYKVRIVKVGVARRGAMAPVAEQLSNQGQILTCHDGLTGRRVAQVMQAQTAELRVRADRAPAGREAVRAPAFGVARE